MTLIVVAVIVTVAGHVFAFRTSRTAFEAVRRAVTLDIGPNHYVTQLLAMLGYSAYTPFIFLQPDSGETRIAGGFGSRVSDVIYGAILVSSAPYMSLIMGMRDDATRRVGLAIWAVLAIVSLASLGLVRALRALRPGGPRWAPWLAAARSIGFTIHTALPDAAVWPALPSLDDDQSVLRRAVSQAAN